MGDKERNDLEQWIVERLRSGQQYRPEELSRDATAQGVLASPSAVAWAVWHLVSAGKVQVTRDYFVTAG